jgi:hypothetical protein
MGEAHSRTCTCTHDANVSRFELLAENKEQRTAFRSEVKKILESHTPAERGEFLLKLRECFDAQKKLNPNVDLPHFDFLPHPHLSKVAV